MNKVFRTVGMVFILFCSVNSRSYTREIVYLHLNKKIFVSGEQICFKGYENDFIKAIHLYNEFLTDAKPN